MSEKRFQFGIMQGTTQAHIRDCETCKSATIELYDDNIKYFIDLLNSLNDENEQLKEYCAMLKNQIKKMGEIGGFNKHMIKTILESNYDD